MYLVSLGATEPLTVILQTRTQMYEGLCLLFSDKLLVEVQLIDTQTPTHPFVIGEVIAGDVDTLNLGVTWINDYTLQRITHRQRSDITTIRRYFQIWTLRVRSHIRRYAQFPYSYRKTGELKFPLDNFIQLW